MLCYKAPDKRQYKKNIKLEEKQYNESKRDTVTYLQVLCI